MTQPRPAMPDGEITGINVELTDLPVLRSIARRWNGLILANSSIRREAKALMFGELAAAARRGVPLDIALEMNAQNVAERARPTLYGASRGADSRNALSWILWAAGGLFTYTLWIWLYFVMAFRAGDPERVARLLARRLHRIVTLGRTLSNAMTASGDYDLQEIAIIKSAEDWDALPAALERFADYQKTRERMGLQAGGLAYPLALLLITSTIITFWSAKIAPKFADIYHQLGAELPRLTSLTSSWTFAMTRSFSSGLPALLAIAVIVLFMRALMNGNLLSKYLIALQAVPLIAGATVASFAATRAAVESLGPAHASTVALAASVGAAIGVSIISVVALPWILFSIERLVLWCEHAASALLQSMALAGDSQGVRRFLPFVSAPFRIPIIGQAARLDVRARWLSTVAVALESRIPAGDAVRAGGRVCGGSMERRSLEAASAIENGVPFGRACLEHDAVGELFGHRLVALELGRDLPRGLDSLARDAAFEAAECAERASRITEAFIVLVIGLVCGVLVLSLYSPLFSLPGIVMRK